MANALKPWLEDELLYATEKFKKIQENNEETWRIPKQGGKPRVQVVGFISTDPTTEIRVSDKVIIVDAVIEQCCIDLYQKTTGQPFTTITGGILVLQNYSFELYLARTDPTKDGAGADQIPENYLPDFKDLRLGIRLIIHEVSANFSCQGNATYGQPCHLLDRGFDRQHASRIIFSKEKQRVCTVVEDLIETCCNIIDVDRDGYRRMCKQRKRILDTPAASQIMTQDAQPSRDQSYQTDLPSKLSTVNLSSQSHSVTQHTESGVLQSNIVGHTQFWNSIPVASREQSAQQELDLVIEADVTSQRPILPESSKGTPVVNSSGETREEIEDQAEKLLNIMFKPFNRSFTRESPEPNFKPNVASLQPSEPNAKDPSRELSPPKDASREPSPPKDASLQPSPPKDASHPAPLQQVESQMEMEHPSGVVLANDEPESSQGQDLPFAFKQSVLEESKFNILPVPKADKQLDGIPLDPEAFSNYYIKDTDVRIPADQVEELSKMMKWNKASAQLDKDLIIEDIPFEELANLDVEPLFEKPVVVEKPKVITKEDNEQPMYAEQMHLDLEMEDEMSVMSVEFSPRPASKKTSRKASPEKQASPVKEIHPAPVAKEKSPTPVAEAKSPTPRAKSPSPKKIDTISSAIPSQESSGVSLPSLSLSLPSQGSQGISSGSKSTEDSHSGSKSTKDSQSSKDIPSSHMGIPLAQPDPTPSLPDDPMETDSSQPVQSSSFPLAQRSQSSSQPIIPAIEIQSSNVQSEIPVSQAEKRLAEDEASEYGTPPEKAKKRRGTDDKPSFNVAGFTPSQTSRAVKNRLSSVSRDILEESESDNENPSKFEGTLPLGLSLSPVPKRVSIVPSTVPENSRMEKSADISRVDKIEKKAPDSPDDDWQSAKEHLESLESSMEKDVRDTIQDTIEHDAIEHDTIERDSVQRQSKVIDLVTRTIDLTSDGPSDPIEVTPEKKQHRGMFSDSGTDVSPEKPIVQESNPVQRVVTKYSIFKGDVSMIEDDKEVETGEESLVLQVLTRFTPQVTIHGEEGSCWNLSYSSRFRGHRFSYQ